MLLEKFETLIDTPEAVEELRKLILDAAMRGKLVPQDPNDEPASVLLEKIKEEKERLVKEKKIQKQKVLPPVESSYKIPENWIWTRIGNIVYFERGITFPATAKMEHMRDGLIACARTTNVQEQFNWSDMIYIDKGYIKGKQEKLVRTGDILMSSANSRELVGKVSYMDVVYGELTFGGFLLCIRTLKPCFSKFVYYLFRKMFICGEIQRLSSQTTNIANININKLSLLKVPLPPYQEQKRIVAKLDQLMTFCDHLKETIIQRQKQADRLNQSAFTYLQQSQSRKELENNLRFVLNNFNILCTRKEDVQLLRQTILSLAVQGKLVPQDPNDEPASVLLEKIKEEKERLVKEGKIRKQKPLPPIKEEEIPYEVPEGWEWVRLGSICWQITDGTHTTPAYTESGIPFLSVKDISKGRLDFSNTKFISKETHKALIKRCNPQYGDILLTKVGTTGIAKVVDTHKEFSIFVSLALLKVYKNEIDPYYLEMTINSPLVREQSKEGTAGVGNKNLVLKKIKNFIIPLPPLNEQKRIVAKVDQLMSLCNQLEELLERSNQAVNQLLQSLLKKAFSNQHETVPV